MCYWSLFVRILCVIDDVVVETKIKDFVNADIDILIIEKLESLILTEDADVIECTNNNSRIGEDLFKELVILFDYISMIKDFKSQEIVNVDCKEQV